MKNRLLKALKALFIKEKKNISPKENLLHYKLMEKWWVGEDIVHAHEYTVHA